MSQLVQLFKAKWFTSLKEPTASFAGKTIIVTGANSGVGFEASVKFAKLGVSTLILAVRSAEKGSAAKAAIAQGLYPSMAT